MAEERLKEMFHILSHEGTANPNYFEILSYTCYTHRVSMKQMAAHVGDSVE